ncbi:ribose utilization transcriptional repressor RbsR [Levilactobacillus bambusae]|uniref:LacI family transcriptional regulator n=1 Tax=Levilactobacillus bambusae TaxID=2024736 RepID=A0A2V1N1S1_9LACO|nr:LacI family DNA-binding transcriptional regulator [Levilactobacillus bambusae]PWG00658.1 LacI family transcriptional regulator [Levilactobacillus bambusae]
MAGKVTIRDVAAIAGVSVTTVSQILNGKGERFTPETQERVKQAQQNLGYVPNYNARNLVSQSTRTIGVLVPDLSNAFFTSFIRGIQTRAKVDQFVPLILETNRNEELERDYVQELVQRTANGIIISSAAITSDTIDNLLKPNHIPYILFDQNTLTSGDRVDINEHEGGRLAAQHLIELGHRQVAIMMPKQATLNIQARYTGFCAEFQKIGELPKTVLSDMTPQAGYSAADTVRKLGVSAVFAINDEMAIGLMKGLKDAKVSVPEQVSVIGYDDVEMGAYVTPMLTTIHQPIYEMGVEAAKLLVDRIHQPDAPYESLMLPVSLVVRQSTRRREISD